MGYVRDRSIFLLYFHDKWNNLFILLKNLSVEGKYFASKTNTVSRIPFSLSYPQGKRNLVDGPNCAELPTKEDDYCLYYEPTVSLCHLVG